MKIAIIGNSITDISSGKFLEKFLKMLSPVSVKIYLINDGAIKGDLKCNIIGTTYFAKIIKEYNKNIIFSILSFIIGQIGSSFGLIKCMKNIDNVFILPITDFLPVFFAKIFGKKVYLYEAQDIYSEYSTSSISGILKYRILLFSRNITLLLVDCIVIEGEHVVPPCFKNAYSSKIKVCPQYVDDIYRMEKALDKREKNIGYIGPLETRKGAIEFAKAIPIILRKREDLFFYIVGRGTFSEEIKKILYNELSRQKVIMIESIPENDFPDFLNELQLYVLPSISEGLPNTILEAMACGTPVLATPVGAIPDVIEDGKTGYILESRSPECIAQNVVRVFEDPHYNEISLQAKELIENEYTYEKAIKRYEQLFENEQNVA